MVEAGGKKLFLNVYAPTAKLVIVGAVHISQALAPLARSLDYDVTVVDPRTAFASPERFPDVPLVAEWPDVALPPLNIDHYTAFVALTHDPKIDDPALLHAFERDCFYIGALGSRKTHAKRGERLRAQGAQDSRHRAHPCARSALRSARCRRRRSRSSIMAEITAQLPTAAKEKKKQRHEVRSRQSDGGDRRGDRPYPAPGVAGAEERHDDRPSRGRGADAARASRKSWWCGSRTGDVSEDVAAASIAQAVAGDGINVERAFTGRANLFAARAGVLVVDRASGRPHQRRRRSHHLCHAFRLQAGGRRRDGRDRQDSFRSGSKAKLRDAAVKAAGGGALRIAPYVIKRVGIVSTLLPGLAPKVVEKTLRVTAERLAPAGAAIIAERRVPHDETALTAAIKELLGARRRTRDRVRGVRDRRPARRDSGGDLRHRRHHRAFRHAGRSRQSAC